VRVALEDCFRFACIVPLVRSDQLVAGKGDVALFLNRPAEHIQVVKRIGQPSYIVCCGVRIDPESRTVGAFAPDGDRYVGNEFQQPGAKSDLCRKDEERSKRHRENEPVLGTRSQFQMPRGPGHQREGTYEERPSAKPESLVPAKNCDSR
jgi:hypothetical protein